VGFRDLLYALLMVGLAAPAVFGAVGGCVDRKNQAAASHRRQIDLTGTSLRREANFDSRQEPKLNDLLGEGIGHRSNSQAGDDRGDGLKHDHRSKPPVRNHPNNWAIDGPWIGKQQRTLTEEVQGKG
jgi:hypothetical protein